MPNHKPVKNFFAKASVSRLLAQYDKAMLNIGCGTDYKTGWINIDNNSDHNIEKLDLNWDLRDSLPFADNSIDFIFNEHLLEHLTVEEGKLVIGDLMRILKPGGVMRIAVPDLEVIVDKYLHVPLKNDQVIKNFDLGFVETPAEWINMAFRWWDHKWLYDWEEIQRRIREAGYTKISRCELNKSRHKELCGLETRPESLVVEVTK